MLNPTDYLLLATEGLPVRKLAVTGSYMAILTIARVIASHQLPADHLIRSIVTLSPPHSDTLHAREAFTRVDQPVGLTPTA